LYHLMRVTMPKLAMGSLAADDYAAVFAFLLERNGWPAGRRRFDGSDTMLSEIRLGRVAVASAPAALAPREFIAGKVARPPDAAGPSPAELAGAISANWPYHNGNYAGTRYSELTELTPANVGGLGVACVFQVGPAEVFQTGPVVYRGVMYVTTARQTVAVDAATCRPRWRHTWQPRDYEIWPLNRGATLARGFVVRGTADGYLLALDARDGQVVWARHVVQPLAGETITMPPLIYDDLVIVGPAGSEKSIKGWIGAFRLADGKPVWRFNTVPRAGEPGAETWGNPRGLPQGGGAVWTPLTLDPAKGELYVAVTNPAPDFAGHLRPGKNLYTNAVVALDVRTGALRWYDQRLPNDTHDWDLTQVSPLFRETVGGRERSLVATVGKAGMLTVLDRDTHERVYEVPITTRLNADAPFGKTRARVCPGVHGGVEWNGPAYSPRDHMLYVAAVDWCGVFQAGRTARLTQGDQYFGGAYTSDSAALARGWLTAVDARSGSVRWRYRSAKPLVAAVTATAGGVVFTGELTGDFIALDARSGRELYRFYTGSGLMGGVVTYAVRGKQYVAAASGGGSYIFGREGTPTIFVFALPTATPPSAGPPAARATGYR
jgi:PQQ-dependent dehydrogenase (methanol/ethanol family)